MSTMPVWAVGSWRSVSGLAASRAAQLQAVLYHVTKGKPVAMRPVKLAVPKRVPATLSSEEVLALIGACDHLRDKFLFALLAETGMRVGQALGLRHSDFVSQGQPGAHRPRDDNANGARAKTPTPSTVPVSGASGAVVLGVSAHRVRRARLRLRVREPVGGAARRPVTYAAVAKLVARLRSRTVSRFTLHVLRHTAATEMIRAGVPIEVVSKLLTHRSSTVTSQTYVHLDAADLRAELARAGLGGWDGER